jgi:hypothetical protein
VIVVRGLKRLFDEVKLLGLKPKQNPSPQIDIILTMQPEKNGLVFGFNSTQAIIIE